MQLSMQGISTTKQKQFPLSSDLHVTSLSQVHDGASDGIYGKSCITIALLLLTTNIMVAFLVTMVPASLPTNTIIAQPLVPAGTFDHFDVVWTSSPILKDFDRIHKSPKHLKLTFVVGLEGSGHHFWGTIFENMAKLSQNDTQSGQVVMAGKKLKYCLNLCFRVSYWGDSMTNKLKKLMDKRGMRIWRKYDDLCDCVVDQLKQYADTLQDGSLLAFGWAYSYPFGGSYIERFPDLELLISMAQSPKLAPYIFDVRLIVMKRDVATCLVSSCVHRFGHCETRMKYAERGLSLIQTQLMGIDPQFWIMLDYDHLATHLDDSGYVDIFAKWLSVEPAFVEMASSNSTPSNTTLQQTQWDELQNYNKTSMNLTKIIKRVFYADGEKRKWPIFNDPHFCVSPDNTIFLDSKLDLDFTIQSARS